MRKIREILRMRFECKCSYENISKSIGISSSTAIDCVKRAKTAGLNWPLPNELTDEQLERKLYLPVRKINQEQRGEIDWAYIHKELKRKHVTVMLLWSEYKSQHPQGVGYSQFCDLYRNWKQQLDVWMRQPHKAGERLFVDYAGQTVSVVCDSSTGELAEAQIFVATLGASNYTYTEATWTQTLPDWIQSHVNAFEFFQGCPEIVVPDNLLCGAPHNKFYVEQIIMWSIQTLSEDFRC